MSAPLTASDIPMKNQMELSSFVVMFGLPEIDVECREDHGHSYGPECRAFVERYAIFLRDVGGAIDEADKLVVRLRPGHKAHRDSDDHAQQTRPERAVHVLRHVLGGR